MTEATQQQQQQEANFFFFLYKEEAGRGCGRGGGVCPGKAPEDPAQLQAESS